MTDKKIYACYRLPEKSDPFRFEKELEFWAFNKNVYDHFVSDFQDSLLQNQYEHVILPSSYLENDRWKTDRMLDIYVIDEATIIATGLYTDMFYETDPLESLINRYFPLPNMVRMLPKRLQQYILQTGWNHHVCLEDIDNVRLWYIIMRMYFRSCEFGDLFDLPKRLI